MYLFFFDTGEVASVSELTQDIPDGIISIVRISPLAVLDIDNGVWEDIESLDESEGVVVEEAEEPCGFKLGAVRVINPEYIWRIGRMRF